MAEASSTDKKAEVTATTHQVPLLSGLLGSGKYSDLTLTCGSRSWKVHKGVLCLQSDFFAKACDGNFKEAHTNTIDLSDDSEYTIAAMVNFMYNGKYDAVQILPSEDYAGGVAMLLHVRVVGLAQKYFIQPLETYAGGLASKLMKQWDGASPIFAECVHAIYTSTEDTAFGTSLCERAVEVAMDKALLLFGPGNEHLSHTRQIFLDETPGFMEDWAKAMSHCNDILSTANTSLEAVNDALNSDNVKLNEKIIPLKVAADKAQEESTKASKELKDLVTRHNNLSSEMMKMVNLPVPPTANPSYAPSGPAPRCYRCPNCEVMFFRTIPTYGGFHHSCYDNGWCGKLGKGGVQLGYQEWQAHRMPTADFFG